MYIRGGIRLKNTLQESLFPVLLTGVWSLLILLAHEVAGWKFIALPQLPVTTIGVVVGLYLGFKSNSAYARWWEARQIWGAIINNSRFWANQALNTVEVDGDAPTDVQRAMVRRHIAWVICLAHQLRRVSRLGTADRPGVFNFRPRNLDKVHTASQQHYQSFLSAEEAAAVAGTSNPAVHILDLQGRAVRALRDKGQIDDNRFVALMATIGALLGEQGKCERIKNTPFPRQLTDFGRAFTWVFIALLPLAFIDAFEIEATKVLDDAHARRDYLLIYLPFTILVAWIFYMLEKVSESCEDPFEWGPTDVPIAALSRVIEIDLLQLIGEQDVPPPIEPIEGVLY